MSGEKNKVGVLYLVATPIGNLEDITLRALRILKEADLIAAEDTRTAKKLLARYNIKTPVTSYYDYREKQKSPKLVGRLKKGSNIALISEAGTPGISDPGYRLIHLAIKAGIRVVPVPGPSAVTAGLSVSGLLSSSFTFEGFLPSRKIALRKKLYLLQDEERTMVFYDSPRRLFQSMIEMQRILGERPVAVARELTKKFEEVIRGNIGEVLEQLKEKEIKGEIVIVVEGKKGTAGLERVSASQQVHQVQKELGISRMEAIKLVARLRGKVKSEIYRECQD